MLRYSGYIEYISRKGRYELASLLLEETEKEMLEKRKQAKNKGEKVGRGRADVLGEVARRLGVSKLTVFKWRKGDYQASNEVTSRIVELTSQLYPEKTQAIIEKDIENSKQEFERILQSLRKQREGKRSK